MSTQKPYVITELPLADAFLLQLPRYADERGFFAEIFRNSLMKELGLAEFVQDNLSFSHKNVLRGLHFQHPPHAQAKLVTVLQGWIQDILVDLRPSSPTYKQWYSVDLRGDSSLFSWVYVPVGFAHGFLVRSDQAIVLYKCSAYYVPAADGGIRWDDPALAIRWALTEGEQPILSHKDANLPYLSEIRNPFEGL
ncbi:MAG: dTDP-4-dehydrorhamnose 3,5-epimerase [Bacteroidia bacterium]|nr:dTDP-4-dehydrorhamnose 3,5-epimerase [Bacteroidia bacterium]MDW8134887.1 dTDP-4-dehydrorhamnose 3,5-epimerase [Bacteroidia bacterium]